MFVDKRAHTRSKNSSCVQLFSEIILAWNFLPTKLGKTCSSLHSQTWRLRLKTLWDVQSYTPRTNSFFIYEQIWCWTISTKLFTAPSPFLAILFVTLSSLVIIFDKGIRIMEHMGQVNFQWIRRLYRNRSVLLSYQNRPFLLNRFKCMFLYVLFSWQLLLLMVRKAIILFSSLIRDIFEIFSNLYLELGSLSSSCDVLTKCIIITLYKLWNNLFS